MTEPRQTYHVPSVMNYVVGYLCSMLLTIAAFGLAYFYVHAEYKSFSSTFLVQVIATLSLAQLAVQAIFFLHVSGRKEERFNFMAFVFTLYTVAFIVIGSLWIMNNLNENMTPEQIEKYLHKEN